MSESRVDAAQPQPALPRAEAVLGGLADAVVVADATNTVVYVNRAAEALLGWTSADLVGRPLVTIVPERLRPDHIYGFNRYLTTHEAHLIGGPAVHLPAARADGSEITIELTMAAVTDADGYEIFAASLRPVVISPA